MRERPMTEAESALIEAALAYEARWGAQFDSITHVPEDAVGRSVANTARAVRAEREEAARPKWTVEREVGSGDRWFAKGKWHIKRNGNSVTYLAYNLDEAQAIACRDALAREAGEQP